MQSLRVFDWRRLTNLAVGTATTIRDRAFMPKPAPAAVAEIDADPIQTASDHLARAYGALRQADPGATDAQLFSQLRLLTNKLEHGGLRRESRAPQRSQQVQPIADQVASSDWLGALRGRSRRLRGVLRRLA